MPKLNIPQGKFLQMPQKFRAYVAGYGSGKTWVGCSGMCAKFWSDPKVNQGYFAPTFPHIRDIFFPTIEEVAHSLDLRVVIREGNKEVHFYSGSAYRGTTICRSMENPANIVGFKIGNALIDELDILEKEKARLAWRKIIARLRWENANNGADVTTTPEGFRFVYEQFKKLPEMNPALRSTYGLIQASTHDNAKNLPADYIPTLIEAYPEALISAYLDGQFVNLMQGTVYSSFKRKVNLTPERIKPQEHLHIGMDFNVGKMAAAVHVIRDGRPYCLDELTGLLDTPAMIRSIQRKFPGHKIFIYPDASGDARKSQNASESDIFLLKQIGYTVLNDPANPAVRDRVMSMNKAFENGYWINPDFCPTYCEAVEQQAYNKNGEPDKTSGFDHINDAAGYFITYKFPVPTRGVQRVKVGGT